MKRGRTWEDLGKIYNKFSKSGPRFTTNSYIQQRVVSSKRVSDFQWFEPKLRTVALIFL